MFKDDENDNQEKDIYVLHNVKGRKRDPLLSDSDD